MLLGHLLEAEQRDPLGILPVADQEGRAAAAKMAKFTQSGFFLELEPATALLPSTLTSGCATKIHRNRPKNFKKNLSINLSACEETNALVSLLSSSQDYLPHSPSSWCPKIGLDLPPRGGTAGSKLLIKLIINY